MADQLATDIIARIKAHAEPGGEEITTTTELTSLGIHSLELTEIIFDLEEEYGIEIEMNGRCLEQSEECRRHGRSCSRADREKSLN
jgi:acyl carrier protein